MRIKESKALNWALSPDGSRVVLAGFQEQVGRLRFLSLDGSAARDVVARGWERIKSVDWAADGKSVFAPSIDREGDSVLLAIDLNGNAREILRTPKSTIIDWAFPSLDGKHVAVRQTVGANNVWMIDRP